MLYFGDGLRSDIVPAKKFAHWDTVYIYEEMEAEIGEIVRPKSETNEKEQDDGEPATKKLKTDADSNEDTETSRVHYRSFEQIGSF